MVRLTDRPDMTLDVYRGCKATIQQQHGSTTISYPQCSLTFLLERSLHSCREQSFAIRAYAMNAVGIDVVSVHQLFAYRVVSTVSTDIVSSHTKYRKGILRLQ